MKNYFDPLFISLINFFRSLHNVMLMKRHFSLQLFAVILVSVALTGCNKAGKQSKGSVSDGKEPAVGLEMIDTVKVKNQIVEIIRKFPKAVEIVELLNEAGASYIYDLAVPPEYIEKMMTSTQKALVIGMLAFDIKYASVYNRGDVFLKTRNNLNRLEAELGLQGDLKFVEKYQKRIENNKSNTDSINILTTRMWNDFHQYMQEGAHADVYALTSIGANIEALYVLSQLTLLAKENDKLLSVMNNQNQRVKSIASLLEIMSGDENVKSYYVSIQPVIKFFVENETIKNADLNKIAPLIEKARNDMIQK